MKKILPIILSVVMLLTICVPLVSYASTSVGDGKAILLQEDNYAAYDLETVSVSDNSSLTTTLVRNKIYNALLEFDTTININTYKIDVSDFGILYSDIINDNPDLFFVSSSYSYTYNTSTNCVVSFVPEYTTTDKTELEQQQIIYNKGLNKALAQVDDSMTDEQKVVVIHDYICSNAIYPNLGTYDSTTGSYPYDKPDYHSAYGFFNDQNCVCAGYTLTFSAIMHKLGIECEYVRSDSLVHAWNAVKIDGYWYNVDLTYDDISFALGQNVMGNFAHNCLLKSDECFQTNECLLHSGIIYPDGVSCTSTKYDDYFWDDNTSNIYVVDGDYYYINNSPSTNTATLYSRDADGNTKSYSSTALRSYSISSSKSVTNSTTGETTVIYTYYFSFTKLVLYQDNLYMSYVDKQNHSQICVVDTDNNAITALESPKLVTNNFVMGMGVYKNEIYYLLYPNIQNASYSNYVDINRMSKFNTYYDSDDRTYNIYIDCNNDGVINSKDYAIIYNTDKDPYYYVK